jgi:hypothetical protein
MQRPSMIGSGAVRSERNVSKSGDVDQRSVDIVSAAYDALLSR